MKRSKSGAQKRKEAATARDAVAKLPKMTDFFKITEQSKPGTSTERDEENYSVQEKEDDDDQHQSDCEFPENVSCDLPANTQPSISKISESQFTPIPDDPCKWPESISDAQRCVAGTERLGSHFHRKKRWKSCLRNKVVDSSFIKMEFSFVGVYLV